MKKQGFIRNKIVECIVKTNVEKATLIPHTNVTHGRDDSNKLAMHGCYETNNIWIWHIRSHFLSPSMLLHMWMDVAWKLVQTSSCHFFTCTDLTKKKNQYCGTWYGFDRGVFATMFADPLICTFMTMNLIMKITLKSHGLLICVSLWDWMIFSSMSKKKKITTNLQVHPPLGKKCLFKWVT